MRVEMNRTSAEGAAAKLDIGEEEAVRVMYPRLIAAFQGRAGGREDRFLNLKGIYRSKKWIESVLKGPAQAMIGVPAGCCLHTLEIGAESSLLFDMRHVLFYSDSLKLESRFQRMKQALITFDWVKMKFSGPGTLGLLSRGPLVALELNEEQPLYADIGHLVAYPEEAAMRLCVYGNPLASQRMNYHWEIKGEGHVLLQAASGAMAPTGTLGSEPLIKRVLREVLPFGGIWIR